METTRGRLGSAVEWVLAAVFMATAAAIGSVGIRELRPAGPVSPVVARAAAPVAVPTPAGLPARAVSVPVLLLPGGKSVRVGDTAAAVAASLGRQAEIGTQTVEQGRYGDRLTRFYEHAGTRFALVFEAFEPRGEARVAAIYLQ